MTEYPNWFINDGQQNFQKHLLGLKDQPIRALQIGAYTGDASVWIAENVLHHEDSVLVDVDTWLGSDEPVHHGMDWSSVETIYDLKTVQWRDKRKIVKYKSTSDYFFKNNLEQYDFIYIDGDHTSYGVIKDAVNAYEVLKDGGIIAFDDYEWRGGTHPHLRPKKAIDAFLDIYRDRVVVLTHSYQCWIKKERA